MTCLTMVSPRPIPSEFKDADLCSLPNIVNSLLKSSYAMPTPVSLMWTTSIYSIGLKLALIVIEPSSVNLSAFLIKLINTYLNRLSSPISKGSCP